MAKGRILQVKESEITVISQQNTDYISLNPDFNYPEVEVIGQEAGTKKSYISKLENGKGNIQLSTLIRIFEQGLNRRIGLTFL